MALGALPPTTNTLPMGVIPPFNPETLASKLAIPESSTTKTTSAASSATSSANTSPTTTTVGRFTVKKVDSPGGSNIVSNGSQLEVNFITPTLASQLQQQHPPPSQEVTLTVPTQTLDTSVPPEVELSMARSVISALQKEKERLEEEIERYRETNYERLRSDAKKREVTSGFWRGGLCAVDEHNLAAVYCIKCKKKLCKKCSIFIHHFPHKQGHKLFQIGKGQEEEKNPRVLLQGFNWESCRQNHSWYKILECKLKEIVSGGITTIWLPPPSESCSAEGYMPGRYYNLNSQYGSYEDLKSLIEAFRSFSLEAMADIVINHRTAQEQSKSGRWNVFGGMMKWDSRAIVADQAGEFGGRGNRKDNGELFTPAPNIDHSQEFVREDIKRWLNWLRLDVGFDCFRFDFVKGYWGGYTAEYCKASMPTFAVGEFWSTMSYGGDGALEHDQDLHRQSIVDWIDSTDGTSSAFDFTTKGVLQEAINRREYWRLRDRRSLPPGVIGWYPERAVTFLENHDTGSTQGHWPFPSDKILQGYAYILTHPGIPCVFWDHMFDWGEANYRAITDLIQLRKRNRIHASSKVYIVEACADFYAAIIDDKVAMKIGPGDWSPSSPQIENTLPVPTTNSGFAYNTKEWSISCWGDCYAVWELKIKAISPPTTQELNDNDPEEEQVINKLNAVLSTSRDNLITFSSDVPAEISAPAPAPSSSTAQHSHRHLHHRRTPSLQAFVPNW